MKNVRLKLHGLYLLLESLVPVVLGNFNAFSDRKNRDQNAFGKLLHRLYLLIVALIANRIEVLLLL